MIRIILPAHLRSLINVTGEIKLDINAPVTLRSVLDALEARYPALCGTIRDHITQKRRPLVRFYASQTDFSYESADTMLPDSVISGQEPFIILGAIAGG